MDCIEEDSIRIPYLGRLWNFDVWRVSCENRFCDEHIIITKMPALDELGVYDGLGFSSLLRRIEKNGAFMLPHEEVYDYDDLKEFIDKHTSWYTDDQSRTWCPIHNPEYEREIYFKSIGRTA